MKVRTVTLPIMSIACFKKGYRVCVNGARNIPGYKGHPHLSKRNNKKAEETTYVKISSAVIILAYIGKMPIFAYIYAILSALLQDARIQVASRLRAVL